MKTCFTCKIEKPLSEFRKAAKEKVGVASSCRECARAYGKSHYLNNKDLYTTKARAWNKRTAEFIRQAKTKPCADCAGIFHPAAMDFDHVRGKKLFDLGRGKNSGRAKIEAEIAKCEVVCANCHRIRTFNRRVSSVGRAVVL